MYVQYILSLRYTHNITRGTMSIARHYNMWYIHIHTYIIE